MMITNSLARVKDAPPYSKELEGPVLLNSPARPTYKTGSCTLTKKRRSSMCRTFRDSLG